MLRRGLISITFALLNFLTIALSSTITPAPTPAPTPSYRDPLVNGITFKSGSINGTITIWTAYFSETSLGWPSAEGTVTDEVTSLIWSETRIYSSPAGLVTDIDTNSCQMGSTAPTWCMWLGSEIMNGTTALATGETLTGGALAGSLATKTVSNGLLVTLNTVLTPTNSSKLKV